MVPPALLKRFVESVIGFARKYRANPFLRTEVNVIVFQVLLSFLLVAFITAALVILYESTLNYIVADIQQQIFSSPEKDLTGVIVTQEFREVNFNNFIVVLGASVLFIIILGYLTIRIALQPVKYTLTAQKQFIGNVAHELRTPLSIIKTNTELSILEGGGTKSDQEIHASNLEELDHISEIINNLLTLNTLVTPGVLQLSPVSITGAVTKAMEKLSILAEKKRITISVASSGNTTVWGNLSAVEQIATNLIKNAIVYTPDGGTISVASSEESDKSVNLRVTDTGIGIDEKDLFRVFEPFYRTDTSRQRSGGGSGLGLTIVSELVRLHRGRITIESIPHKGTTVSVFLPSLKHPHAALVKHGRKTDAKDGEITIDFSKKVTGRVR